MSGRARRRKGLGRGRGGLEGGREIESETEGE